jgi:glyoxylase-like metal-dependent hydrolase (beta-lactamase superfamily II)
MTIPIGALREVGMRMRLLIIGLTLAGAAHGGRLEEKVWIHGAADCGRTADPPIEVFEADASTYILRQNKCAHFEAPFMYVLFGAHTVFVQDTGAIEEADRAPVYDLIRKLIAEKAPPSSRGEMRILVTHSHSHGDHTAGDAQFQGRPGVTLVPPTAEGVRSHFGFDKWPEGVAKLDLGGRELLVTPAPGHQDESVVVYDPQTHWLLTGDTVLPGQLYVRDWEIYRTTIAKLAAFVQAYPVTAVMGTHVEMSKSGQIYERGSTFQPDEVPLPLTTDDLLQLDAALRKAGAEPQAIALPKFVVVPISAFQRMIGDFLKWVTGG